MKMFNVHAAKAQLSRLIEQAAAGEEIVIAKAGKPVARLIPFEPWWPREPMTDLSIRPTPRLIDVGQSLALRLGRSASMAPTSWSPWLASRMPAGSRSRRAATRASRG